ncbi:MAG: type II secretion system F family protein [Planctomycetales bacterium]|nr:type II secretion system F family protein [Planctomycetales bacterium]
MLTIILIISVGIGVATLIGGVAIAMRPQGENLAEDRLSALTKMGRPGASSAEQSSLISGGTLDDTLSMADEILSKFGNIKHLMEQADVRMSGAKFLTICVVAAAAGAGICVVSPIPKYLLPVFAVSFGILPGVWLLMKRKKRLNQFSQQLPEALELLSRSLRAGHSLAAGMGLVASEMPDPIAREFGRTFEEQNLGITLDEALDAMTLRVPNMDLRFFATAVMLQRQTGGDLAEILDKIGRLIRERFKLAGQIQALTGEGRLSGIVLLALPPGLFCVMYYLNRDYAMVLFKDETGRKLLAAALVLQLVGALIIRKIINIKV